MVKKPRQTDEDTQAFHEAMKGVTPLKKHKIRLTRTFAKKRQAAARDDEDGCGIQLSDTQAEPTLKSDEIIAYKQTSVSHKILRKLRKGQYNVEAKLDLHGMSAEEARNAVSHFLHACIQNGIRVGLIVHGKGQHSQMPVLKNKINFWLRELDMVLAFCSAAPAHGGRGAVYVLLKRAKEENEA